MTARAYVIVSARASDVLKKNNVDVSGGLTRLMAKNAITGFSVVDGQDIPSEVGQLPPEHPVIVVVIDSSLVQDLEKAILEKRSPHNIDLIRVRQPGHITHSGALMSIDSEVVLPENFWVVLESAIQKYELAAARGSGAGSVGKEIAEGEKKEGARGEEKQMPPESAGTKTETTSPGTVQHQGGELQKPSSGASRQPVSRPGLGKLFGFWGQKHRSQPAEPANEQGESGEDRAIKGESEKENGVPDASPSVRSVGREEKRKEQKEKEEEKRVGKDRGTVCVPLLYTVVGISGATDKELGEIRKNIARNFGEAVSVVRVPLTEIPRVPYPTVAIVDNRNVYEPGIRRATRLVVISESLGNEIDKVPEGIPVTVASGKEIPKVVSAWVYKLVTGGQA